MDGIYYIARDRDGKLYMYSSDPKKNMNTGEWESRHLPSVNGVPQESYILKLDYNMFPEVKWEDKKATAVTIVKMDHIGLIDGEPKLVCLDDIKESCINPHKIYGNLYHEPTQMSITCYKRIGLVQKWLLRWLFDLKYIKHE